MPTGTARLLRADGAIGDSVYQAASLWPSCEVAVGVEPGIGLERLKHVQAPMEGFMTRTSIIALMISAALLIVASYSDDADAEDALKASRHSAPLPHLNMVIVGRRLETRGNMPGRRPIIFDHSGLITQGTGSPASIVSGFNGLER